MKKEIISFILYTLMAMFGAVHSVIVDDMFISGAAAFTSVLWGMISGMTLHELLTNNNK